MKNRIKIVLCGIMVCIGIGLGSIYAYASGWITLPGNGEMYYEEIDKASIELYSEVTQERGYNEDGEWVCVLKPKDLVRSVIDRQGNEIDFSNLEVSFKGYDPRIRSFVELSEDEALNPDGTFNTDKNYDFQVTFKYTYNSMPSVRKSDVTLSTISKTISLLEFGL